MVWNIKFIKYRENKLIVTKYVQNVRHRHVYKHASAFAIGQLRHQSATVTIRATHAVDAVGAHRCHELWSRTHVAEWQTRHVATELTRPQSGELCHLVCHSVTCVWDQSSWHRWAPTVSTACVARLGAVTDLSLIHIWRCRRSTLCRSRWSPYH